MFKYTREALSQITKDFKFASNVCTFGSQIFYIGYLIYALCANVGYSWANITLLAVCGLYFLFTATTHNVKDKEAKLAKRNAKHTFRWVKISIKAAVLAMMGYSIYISATEPSTLTIILTAIAVVSWLLSLSLELITMYVENRIELLKESFIKDVKNPVETVSTIVKTAASVSSTVKTVETVGTVVGAVGSVVKNMMKK